MKRISTNKIISFILLYTVGISICFAETGHTEQCGNQSKSFVGNYVSIGSVIQYHFGICGTIGPTTTPIYKRGLSSVAGTR